MVEQSLDAALNSIINVISGCVITLLITMYRQKKKQNDALKAGLQALLRDRMLMCHKVTRKNLIDSNPLFRYYLAHTPCNFFVKPIDSDTSEEI